MSSMEKEPSYDDLKFCKLTSEYLILYYSYIFFIINRQTIPIILILHKNIGGILANYLIFLTCRCLARLNTRRLLGIQGI